MGTETELKFEVAPQDLRKLKAAPALRRKPPKEENLISVYFDTPKHKLARNGVSLRVRHNGDKRLQTVKSEGSDGSFRRGEWECEIKGNVPDLRKVPGTALAPPADQEAQAQAEANLRNERPPHQHTCFQEREPYRGSDRRGAASRRTAIRFYQRARVGTQARQGR